MIVCVQNPHVEATTIRLSAAGKLGYYPVPPEALACALARIAVPDDPARITVLDPCCGQGAALAQIRATLALPAANCYGVELDEGRTHDSRIANPNATILGPADYHQTRITAHSFSMVYVNPPFDHHMGGGERVEQNFFWRAAVHVRIGGLILMVLPQRTWHHNHEFRRSFDAYFYEGMEFAFPTPYRKYEEVFVFGIRRKTIADPDHTFPFSGDEWNRYRPRYTPIDQADPTAPYALWPAPGPKSFEKTMYTHAELIRELELSRLNLLMDDPRPRSKMRPPLALGNGHLGLLLSAGELNGVVSPDGEPPHVVRGSVRKEKYEKECELTVEASGSVTEKKVIAERPIRVVRILDHLGRIKELQG